MKKEWKILIGANLLISVATLSPFLPGPSFMSWSTNTIFSFIQLASLMGFITLPVGLTWTLIELTRKKNENRKMLPIFLWSVPLVAFFLSIWGAGVARDISRAIAIENADQLISAIEKYRKVQNHYPNDVSELTPGFLKNIPTPWIMGISGYNYEKKGDNFNLAFSQNVVMGFNFEVVVYDPKENHKSKGENKASYNAGKKGWKYYVYD